MSFEMALAITNQKTIKDENKDKLKALFFMVMKMVNELERFVRTAFVLRACTRDFMYLGDLWGCWTCVSAFMLARVHVCALARVTEWVFVCNHVRQAVMNGVFETERSVEFLGLDQIGNRKTNIP